LKTNEVVERELDVEFNKYNIPYMPHEVKSLDNFYVFKALEEYQYKLAFSIDRQRYESQLMRQQRLEKK
jgi:hypothetical protein